MLVIVCIAGLALLFAGDTAWICDEPRLIQNALMANGNGVLVTHGLMGTQGTYYGPLVTWVYQVYLAISLNLVLLVLLRSLAMLTLTAGALWIIARSMQVRTVGFAVALFSPFFWLYSRQIWDNSFCIPLAAWAVGGYSLFLTRKPRTGLGVCVLSCGALLLTHLMAVPIIVAIALHAILTQRAKLLQARWWAIGGIAVIVAIGSGYWPVLLRGLQSGPPLQMPGADALIFTLKGGDWFGGVAFARIVGQEWLAAGSSILHATLMAGGVVHGLVLLGFALAAYRVTKVLKRQVAATVADHLAGICLLTLLIQFLYYGSRNAIGHVHYYNASWIVYAVLICMAITWMWSWRVGRWAAIAVIGMAVCTLAGLVLQIHRTGGTRSLTYGPTLENQIEVAMALNQLPAGTSLIPLVPDIARLPQRIIVLQKLLRSEGVPQGRMPQPRAAYIVYSSPSPADGRIEVVLDWGGNAPNLIPLR